MEQPNKSVPEESEHIFTLSNFNDPGPRVFLSIFLDNIPVTALADSGADISVVSSHILDSFPGLEVDRGSSVSVRGHGRSAVSETLGVVQLSVDIGGLVAPNYKFQVVDSRDVNHNVILGADFLYKYYLAPSPAHSRLLYAPPESPVELIGRSAHFCHSLYLEENLKLKPRTLEYFTFNVKADPGQVVVFEPDTTHQHKSVALCRSIETVSPEQQITVEILCYAEHGVTLKKGMLLGQVSATETGESQPSVVREIGALEETSGSVADLFEWADVDLEESRLLRVKEVLQSNRPAISLGDCDVGRVELVAHNIKFCDQDQQPIKIPPRRFSGKKREGIEEEIERMLEEDVIEQSSSPWSAPVVPVTKPDGSLRLCVDYRSLNKATYKDAYPLPNIEDALYNLHGVRYFSTLDLVRGYYQVPMADSSKPYTAFSTSAGHWQFKRMPFGLCNAPATFQRLMNAVLSGFSWDRVMAYLDDIILMDATFEEHLESLGKILSCLAKHGLKINPQKCQLFREKVQFLGHEVSVDGLKPDAKNVQAIVDFPTPKTVRQVHRFMGMVNFYRRFIPMCSVVARPLNKLLGSKRLHWTTECQAAFDKLREALTSPPILSYPDFKSDRPFLLYTDASNTGVGACLLQDQEGVPRVIAYVSTTFNIHEVKYSVLDKELTAIRWAVKRLKPFLWGHKFVICCDHKPLSYLQSRKHLDTRLARMLEELGEYDFEIRYIPGKCNVVADALSRANSEELVPLPESPDKYLERFVEVKVRAGGDALFRCFSVFQYTIEEEHGHVRQQVVDEILLRPDRYNMENHPSWRRKIRVIRSPGMLPVFECIQAFANLICTPVFIYEEQLGFVRYEPETLEPDRLPCFIKSYDGVHFNLLRATHSVDDILTCRGRMSEDAEDDLYSLQDECEEAPEVPVEIVTPESRQLLARPGFEDATSPDSIGDSGGGIPKRVRFDPVVHVMELGQAGASEGAADGGAGVGPGTPWRETLNVGAVRGWQSASWQLKKILKLFRECEGDRDSIRKTCLQLKSLRKYAKHISSIFVDPDGLLVRRVEMGQGSLTAFPYLVPFSALGELAKTAHERNGHIGREKLKRLLLPHVFHPNLYIVVADVARSCEQCMRRKPFTTKAVPPTLRIQTQRPFELVSVDLMELPHTPGQFKYVLNAVDHHTKWLAAQPLRNKTSDSCARAFDMILAGLPGLPETVMSDNGTEFCGRPFADLLRDRNIHQKFVTPYSPQSNGLVERINKSLTSILTGLCQTPGEWDRRLPEAVIIYNNTFHREIKQTPAESFSQVTSKLPIGPVTRPFWKRGASTFEPYPVGSLVGRKIFKPRSVARKLSPKYEGPFVVGKVYPNGKTYQIYSEDDPDKTFKVHHSQLRPWTRAPKYLQQSETYRFSSADLDNDLGPPESEPPNDGEYVLPVPGLDPAVFDFGRVGTPFLPGPSAVPVGRGLLSRPEDSYVPPPVPIGVPSLGLGRSIPENFSLASLGLDDGSEPCSPTFLGFGNWGEDPDSVEQRPEFEWDHSDLSPFHSSALGSLNFSGFEECEIGGQQHVSARTAESGGELTPVSDLGLEVSPGVWAASVSPQVGDSPGSLVGSEVEGSAASASWPDSTGDSEFTLPSLPSAVSGDSPVSWADISEEFPPDSLRPEGYLTRAARSRLFPGKTLDEVLDNILSE